MTEEEFEALADGGWKYEIESLRQQLAAALAACKRKDEALAAWGNLTTTEWLRMVAKALATQPDDAALKAWLGDFPELNPNNYDHEDVCRLNDWGINLALSCTRKD